MYISQEKLNGKDYIFFKFLQQVRKVKITCHVLTHLPNLLNSFIVLVL